MAHRPQTRSGGNVCTPAHDGMSGRIKMPCGKAMHGGGCAAQVDDTPQHRVCGQCHRTGGRWHISRNVCASCARTQQRNEKSIRKRGTNTPHVAPSLPQGKTNSTASPIAGFDGFVKTIWDLSDGGYMRCGLRKADARANGGYPRSQCTLTDTDFEADMQEFKNIALRTYVYPQINSIVTIKKLDDPALKPLIVGARDLIERNKLPMQCLRPNQEFRKLFKRVDESTSLVGMRRALSYHTYPTCLHRAPLAAEHKRQGVDGCIPWNQVHRGTRRHLCERI